MQNDLRVKLACYSTNITMSVVSNISPVLFLTFRELYGISFSLLGLLVLIHFTTQLIIDLIFSFFSHKFNIAVTVKLTPALSVLGLGIYAVWPFFAPDSIYAGLVIGTLVFSASAGLAEVLISPVIAALPAENPDREVSKLHSVYAWGVVFVILVSTLFLFAFGCSSWQYLIFIFMLIPATSTLLFLGARLPRLATQDKVSGVLQFLKNKQFIICVLAIFVGGATECTMSQWCSGYLEAALGIDKVWGDIFGVAIFMVMLGLGRTLYSKYGKSITKILFIGAVGAFICYLIAALSPIPIIGLVACALTGLCVSMLWPGSLIMASDKFPDGGVFLYAMMAAGGDLGASLGPQLVGVIIDGISGAGYASEMASWIGISSEQLGMRIGVLVGSLFAFSAIFVYLYLMIKIKKQKTARE